MLSFSLAISNNSDIYNTVCQLLFDLFTRNCFIRILNGKVLKKKKKGSEEFWVFLFVCPIPKKFWNVLGFFICLSYS